MKPANPPSPLKFKPGQIVWSIRQQAFREVSVHTYSRRGLGYQFTDGSADLERDVLDSSQVVSQHAGQGSVGTASNNVSLAINTNAVETLEQKYEEQLKEEVENAKLEAGIISLNWAADFVRKTRNEYEKGRPVTREFNDGFRAALNLIETGITDQEKKARKLLTIDPEKKALQEAMLELAETIGLEVENGN